MKCVFIQRAAGGVGVRKNHLEIVSQFIVLHFAAIVFEDRTLWILFRNPFCVFSSSSSECSFVCLFVCIKACQHLCQKIFFARFWNTQAHRIARIRYKQKWYCTCRKTMCRFFEFGVVCTGYWQILFTEIPENLCTKIFATEKAKRLKKLRAQNDRCWISCVWIRTMNIYEPGIVRYNLFNFTCSTCIYLLFFTACLHKGREGKLRSSALALSNAAAP